MFGIHQYPMGTRSVSDQVQVGTSGCPIVRSSPTQTFEGFVAYEVSGTGGSRAVLDWSNHASIDSIFYKISERIGCTPLRIVNRSLRFHCWICETPNTYTIPLDRDSAEVKSMLERDTDRTA